jgi:SAM-dependent methyltransferase
LEAWKGGDMARMRGRFEGVGNIVRFNWPFFVVAALGVIGLAIAGVLTPFPWAALCGLAILGIVGPVLVSLLASHFIYDRSELYDLGWLNVDAPDRLVNIHAGFDETSALLAIKFPQAHLRVLDFYDPDKHTEPSIKRARVRYPEYPNTEKVTTRALPMDPASADLVCLILSAHEVRDPTERTAFFREIHRGMAPGGRIVVVEHLRDAPNFLAYTVGFLHFHSRAAWLATFEAAGLVVESEEKHTPFLSVFTLCS